ncbi:MAG: IS701 family transposase [Gemmatimonadaceae bacterium]
MYCTASKSKAVESAVGSVGDWEREFERWLTPFLEALAHKKQRKWAPVYMRGLLGPGERKSIEPMAERVAPDDGEQLHHFLCTSCWDPSPLERTLAEKAQQMVGGQGAVLIVDDTTLLKKGHHSVGVARQYSGAAGKRANCQTLVSLTLAQDEVPVCVGLKLFLPREWTDDVTRMDDAGVPEREDVRNDVRTYQTKMEIALREIDRVRAAGVTFDMVLADAGYGSGAEFRHALSDRGFTWAVGIPRIQKVYPADVAVHMPRRKPGSRARKHPVPNRERESAEDVLASTHWRSVTWRTGTKGPLTARFAAKRVVVADGVADAFNHHLPGEEAWLVGELRASGERKYYLTNHATTTTLRTLAAAIKARWSCEQAHQQMKEELGLDHFKGRSWTGLHHHALMILISFAFLQHLRLTDVRGRGENQRVSSSRSRSHSRGATTRANTPRDPTHANQRAAPATRSLTATIELRCPKCHGRLKYQPPA